MNKPLLLSVVVAVALGVGFVYGRLAESKREQAVVVVPSARDGAEKPRLVTPAVTPEPSGGSGRQAGSILRVLEALHETRADSSAPAGDDAAAAARKKLDERMAAAPVDAGAATRLDRALRSLLESAVLGEAIAELRCGATMCKVSLIAEDQARVDVAASSLAQRIPKTFSAVLALPESPGHKALYVSTNATDLKLTEAVDDEGAEWPEQDGG